MQEPIVVRSESAPRHRPGPRRKAIRAGLIGIAYLAPALLVLGVFVYYPLIRSVYLSLHETDFLGRTIFFAGLDHYKELLSSPRFYNSLRATGLFTLYTVPVGLALAIPVALLGHMRVRGITVYRTIFICTIAVSTAIAAVIWAWLFQPTTGVLNSLLRSVGLTPIRWLQDPNWALISVAITTIWKELGLNVLFLLAGLQAVPDELLEAAQIDGASRWQAFWRVQLPLLSPTIFFLLVVGTIDAFRSFTQVHIMTQGGPIRSTEVLVYSVYRDAFLNYRFSYASTQAITLFLILVALTLIQFRVGERRVHYQ